MRNVTRFFLIAAACCAFSSAAKAELSLCNEYPQEVRVAFANPTGDSYHAAGWWRVKPGACLSADFKYDGVFYYAADSSPVNGKFEHWGNKTQLYVPTKDFAVDHAEKKRRGARGENFTPYDPGAGAGDPAIVFHFTTKGTSISETRK